MTTTLTTSPWLDEMTGKPTKKTYWQLDCDDCGGFISASIAKPKAEVAPRRSEDEAFHRCVCPASNGEER